MSELGQFRQIGTLPTLMACPLCSKADKLPDIHPSTFDGEKKKASTLYIDRGRIERHILPLLGGRRVRDLTTPDILRFMRDVTTGKTADDVKTGFRGRA